MNRSSQVLGISGVEVAEVWSCSHKTCIFKILTGDCITLKIEAQSWQVCGADGLGAAEWIHLWHDYAGSLTTRHEQV